MHFRQKFWFSYFFLEYTKFNPSWEQCAHFAPRFRMMVSAEYILFNKIWSHVDICGFLFKIYFIWSIRNGFHFESQIEMWRCLLNLQVSLLKDFFCLKYGRRNCGRMDLYCTKFGESCIVRQLGRWVFQRRHSRQILRNVISPLNVHI